MDLKESPSEGSLQPSSLQIFANTSTLHGIRHIFVYGPLTIRRVLWAVAFVGSLGLLLVESSERVSYYFSYQHVTKVDEVVAQSLVFPAVTLCNLNGFRFSRLTTNDLYHAGELLALLDVNLQIPDPHLADPTVLEALRQKANFKHYKPKQFSMLEFLHRVGHDLKDMMLYCKFKGQECGHQDFTTIPNLIKRILLYFCGIVRDIPKGIWEQELGSVYANGCSILYVIFDKENCSEEENHEEDKVQRQLGGEDLKELRVAIPEESGIAEPLQATQEKE